jgi:hypothetical protein
MFLKSVVWSAKSQARERAAAEESERRLLVPAFRALTALLPVEEYRQIYTEWERGHREIRIDNGFIMMCFTPERSADGSY